MAVRESLLDSLTDDQRDRIEIVLRHHHDMLIEFVDSASGQFYDVLIVNDEYVFRFPRSDDAAEVLAAEIAVLTVIGGRLPVMVPEPSMSVTVGVPPRPLWMGYRKLAGVPLDRETIDELARVDPAAFEGLASQCGAFLCVLHMQDVDDIAIDLRRADDRVFWEEMRDAFRTELFGFMRRDACAEVEERFEAFLTDDRNFRWHPVLRHGDFGGANLLFEPTSRRLSGVIDFGVAALGDRAVDLASLTACHERLARAMQPVYPELFTPDVRRRATFYRSTFALQQALWAYRLGDDDELLDGLAAYV